MRAPLLVSLPLLFSACTTGPTAEGLPGDSSPDDPAAPPVETRGGKSDAPPVPVPYGGGVVMDAPHLVHVYWGAFWDGETGGEARLVLDGLAGAVGGSSWWHVNDQYVANGTTPGAPVADPAVVVDTSEPPARIKESVLKSFLTSQLAAGTLTWSAETVFVIVTPPGTKPPADECGHHFYFSTSVGGVKRKVIYAFVPWFDDDSCAGGVTVNGGGLDSMTATLTHEYAEAVTDPYLDAWGNGGQVEVADQCDNSFTATWPGGPYAVQQIWSNAASACVQQ